jgi:hypothetical protein
MARQVRLKMMGARWLRVSCRGSSVKGRQGEQSEDCLLKFIGLIY